MLRRVEDFETLEALTGLGLAEEPDGVELSGLLWQATGCLEGASPVEGLTVAAVAGGHPLQRWGTPALLTGLWGSAQTQVAGDGGPRLQGREIVDVHEALGAAWRLLREGPTPGQVAAST